VALRKLKNNADLCHSRESGNLILSMLEIPAGLTGKGRLSQACLPMAGMTS